MIFAILLLLFPFVPLFRRFFVWLAKAVPVFLRAKDLCKMSRHASVSTAYYRNTKLPCCLLFLWFRLGV